VRSRQAADHPSTVQPIGANQSAPARGHNQPTEKEMNMEQFDWGSGIGMAIIMLAFITAVLWVFLPFAVYGIKKRIDKTNELLQAIGEGMPQ
jgi:hypothetical protein